MSRPRAAQSVTIIKRKENINRDKDILFNEMAAVIESQNEVTADMLNDFADRYGIILTKMKNLKMPEEDVAKYRSEFRNKFSDVYINANITDDNFNPDHLSILNEGTRKPQTSAFRSRRLTTRLPSNRRETRINQPQPQTQTQSQSQPQTQPESTHNALEKLNQMLDSNVKPDRAEFKNVMIAAFKSKPERDVLIRCYQFLDKDAKNDFEEAMAEAFKNLPPKEFYAYRNQLKLRAIIDVCDLDIRSATDNGSIPENKIYLIGDEKNPNPPQNGITFAILGQDNQTKQYTIAWADLLTDFRNGNDIHIMSSLPSNKQDFKNSYILINDQLHYIKPSGISESVKIENSALFMQELNKLMKDNTDNKIHLSYDQVRDLITSNGGHPLKSLARIISEKDKYIPTLLRYAAEQKGIDPSRTISETEPVIKEAMRKVSAVISPKREATLTSALECSNLLNNLAKQMEEVSKVLESVKNDLDPDDYATLQQLLLPTKELAIAANNIKLLNIDEAMRNGSKLAENEGGSLYLAEDNNSNITPSQRKQFEEEIAKKYLNLIGSKELEQFIIAARKCNSVNNDVGKFLEQMRIKYDGNPNLVNALLVDTNERRSLSGLFVKSFQDPVKVDLCTKDFLKNANNQNKELELKEQFSILNMPIPANERISYIKQIDSNINTEDAQRLLNSMKYNDMMVNISKIDQLTKDVDKLKNDLDKLKNPPKNAPKMDAKKRDEGIKKIKIEIENNKSEIEKNTSEIQVYRHTLKHDMETHLSEKSLSQLLQNMAASEDPNRLFKNHILDILKACKAYHELDLHHSKNSAAVVQSLDAVIGSIENHNKQYLEKLERGVNNPRSELLAQISHVLKDHKGDVKSRLFSQPDTLTTTLKHLDTAIIKTYVGYDGMRDSDREKPSDHHH